MSSTEKSRNSGKELLKVVAIRECKLFCVNLLDS